MKRSSKRAKKTKDIQDEKSTDLMFGKHPFYVIPISKMLKHKTTTISKFITTLTKETDIILMIGTLRPDPERQVGYYSALYPFTRWLLYRHALPEWLPGVTQQPVVFVRDLGGETVTIYLSSFSERVETLKRRIQLKITNMPFNMRLVYAGRQLDNGRRLAEYNITQESTIHIVLRLRGGGGSSASFVDMSRASFETLKWTDKGPSWKTANPGTCLEAKCTNRKCKAYKHTVIINCGFGVVDLVLDEFECPECHTIVEPRVPAFNNCKWRWSGRASDSSHDSELSEWKSVGDEYKRAIEASSEKKEWSMLMIESTPSDYESYRVPCVVCLETLSTESSKLENAMVGHVCTHSAHLGCTGECPDCPVCDIPFRALTISCRMREPEFPADNDKRVGDVHEIFASVAGPPEGPAQRVHLALDPKAVLVSDGMLRFMQRTGVNVKNQKWSVNEHELALYGKTQANFTYNVEIIETPK